MAEDLKPIFHTPVMHFDDVNGRPLVGGRLYSYKAGTNTPVNLYRAPQGTLLHENPIRLNMRGECVAYGKEGLLYKLVLKDRFGATIWEVDNVSASGGGSGGGGGGGSSVPLVRVAFQNGAWSKISGDDGFIKPNPWGVDSLFLPESCWWSIGVGISVANNTPRDLIQHLLMKYEWNSYISMDVPPLTYEEANLPAMTYEADFTRVNTNNRYTTSLYKKDGATEDWLSVALTAYHDTLPNDLEWALWMNIFKVRDA